MVRIKEFGYELNFIHNLVAIVNVLKAKERYVNRENQVSARIVEGTLCLHEDRPLELYTRITKSWQIP